MERFPPPPKVSTQWDAWFLRFYRAFVNDEGEVTTNHAQLSNLNSGNYSHVTAAQKTDLTDGGDSTLHYHSADRDRSNHVGTQTADTISDFNSAVSAVVVSGVSSADILATQVFGG